MRKKFSYLNDAEQAQVIDLILAHLGLEIESRGDGLMQLRRPQRSTDTNCEGQ